MKTAKKPTAAILILLSICLMLSACFNGHLVVTETPLAKETAVPGETALASDTPVPSETPFPEETASPGETAAPEETPEDRPLRDTYTEKEVNVYDSYETVGGKKTGKSSAKYNLRFYDDIPDVPYTGVNSFLKEFVKSEYTLTREGSVFTYDGGEGFLRIDTARQILTLSNTELFDYHPDAEEEIKWSFNTLSESSTTGGRDKLISLKSYDIAAFSGEDEAYLPFSLVSNLFCSALLHNVAYNGRDLYVIDMLGLVTPEVTDEDYGDGFREPIENGRSQSLTDFNYNMLCLIFDNLRGYTSQLCFGDNNLLTIGLDGILELYYPSIKEQLHSTDYDTYSIGLVRLFSGLSDGGHTSYVAYNLSNVLNNVIGDKMYDPEFSPLGEYLENYIGFYQNASLITQARIASLGNDASGSTYYYYNSRYAIAYIGFNTFDTDYDGWEKYYSTMKEEDIPKETDTYAFVREMLYRAKKDGAKKVVLDLSTNTGGNSDSLIGIYNLLHNANGNLVFNNTVNMSREVSTYLTDVNLDGEFDEKDAEECKKFDFKVCVLTSSVSFSCGNLLPSMLKEAGIKTIGERSGGGSCALALQTTADGLAFLRSSSFCLSNDRGDDIDAGVPVDLDLLGSPEDSNPYAGFFDVGKTSAFLDSAY